jgi:hypothetical protein
MKTLKKLFWSIILSLSLGFAFADDLSQSRGHLLFMMQQGEHEQALTLYQKLFQATSNEPPNSRLWISKT